MMQRSSPSEGHDAARRAEIPYRALVEHLPALIYAETASGPDREAIYIGPQARSMFGHDPDTWISDPDYWRSHIHPDDADRVLAEYGLSIATLETFSAEYRFRHGDGTYVWVRDEAGLVRDERGAPDFWQGFMLDISERKRTEQALHQTEAKYREIVERTPAVTYQELPSDDGRGASIAFVSPQVETMLGYPAELWWQDPDFWTRILHPDDYRRVVEESAEPTRTDAPWRSEYRFVAEDGHTVWVRDEAVLVATEDGRPGFWQGVLIDITERKEAEERLAEAEGRYRAVVEQIPAVVYTQVIDSDGTGLSEDVYVGPQHEDLTGYTVQDFLDNPGLWRELIHPDDRDAVLAEDIASNERADQFAMEYRIVHKNGRTIWVRDEATMIRDEDANPLFWQGFMFDITERKEAEQRVAEALEVEREAARRLRALDEMKNTFLQAVSHDLRTPLAAILGLAVTLERSDLELDPQESRDLARRIASNARKLDRLVRDLLDLDRLSRGIVEPKRHPTEIGALARRMVAESELLAERDVVVETDEVMLDADAAKVERIVENLLANTARHTPPGTTVWVRVERTGQGVLIVVEDDGPGVSEQDREHIFEAFRQGPDAPRHSPGVGVGLTLVARFAELHGGNAWVESREGGGASFRVVLPHHRDPDRGAEASDGFDPAGAEREQLPPRRVDRT